MESGASSHDLRRLQVKAQQSLSRDDYEYFNYVLNEYWQYRNVDGLVLCLLSVLDTPAKMDLLNGIRDIIDEKDVERFDVVAPFKKMAHPPLHANQTTLQRQSTAAAQASSAAAGGGPVLKQREPIQLRQVTLNRANDKQSLGFSICGGREHGMGVFVSTLDPGSRAEHSGLRVGDRLLDVNGMNFEHVAHSTAVKVLRSPGRIVLLVRPAKRPGGRVGQLRVEDTAGARRARSNPDVAGRAGMVDSAENDDLASNGHGPGQGSDLDAHASLHALSELRMGGGSIDVRKVNLPVEPGHPLGIAIRGGKEHSVGIFISHVEERSQAANNGLQLGDQILDVNGVSFLDMTHSNAILTLKQSPLLMMTVKAMGRIPMAGRSTDGQLRWLEPVLDTTQEESSSVGRQSPSLRVPSKPGTPEPTKRHTAQEVQVAESPKKESKARRFQDMLKGHQRPRQEGEEDDDDNADEAFKKAARQRSMTLPSRRSKSLTKADFEDGKAPRRVRKKSQSRDSDNENEDGEVAGSNKASSSPKGQRTSIGGLSAAFGAGQRLVSSMRRRASGSGAAMPDTSPLQALPNNQKGKSSPLVSGRRASASATATPPVSPSPKLSRQDGDGSDASDTRPKDQTRPATGGSSPFFSRGLGSQVMLTSMAAQASKQAQQVLETSASSCMTDAECGALRLHLKRYEDDQNVVDFVTALLPLLNTPRKVELLRDIRSLVAAQHIQQFEQLVSKREREAMMERTRTRPAVGPGAEAKDEKAETRSPEHGQLFSAIQSGRPQLRKVVSSPAAVDSSKSNNRSSQSKSDIFFQSSAAERMLERGRSMQEDSSHGRVRRKDSFVDWNDSHEGVRKRGSQIRHSFATEILVELMKTKPKLGISIEGGVDTKQPEVTISSIIEGGLAAEDGFLQAGFEIKAVDGIAIKGCTHAEAVQRISEAFASDRDILELLVVPEVD